MRRIVILFVVAGVMTTQALAQVTPYVEDFSTDNANWFDSSDLAGVDWVAAGGPDGGAFVQTSFNFVNSVPGPQGPVLFRAEDEHNSSNGAFEGNWITSGITEYRMFVRHTATVPVNFFTRFSSAANFPGATAVAFAPVIPFAWTEVVIPISPLNPQFVSFEGSDFNTVFSSIGHVQVGVAVPADLAGVDQSFNFQLDKAAVIPEPATLALLLGALACAARRR